MATTAQKDAPAVEWYPPWAPEAVARLTAAGQTPLPSATYAGGCHCGRLAFEVTLSPPLEQGHVVVECNCSSCRRFGYQLAYTARENLQWTSPGGQDRCSVYRFNTKQIDHLFCSCCGASIGIDFRDKYAPAFSGYGISVRSLNNVDLNSITTFPNDGVNNVVPAGDLSGQWYEEKENK